jgi:hypothetical protein
MFHMRPSPVRAGALAVLAAALLGLAVPAFARDLTEAENLVLAEAVAHFDAAMGANDMATIIETVPPRVLASIAEQHAIEIDALRQAIVEQAELAMSAVTIVSFGMDLDAAEHEELADGTPYVLIPTETVLDAGQGKMRVRTKTLALLDEEDWYLLRVDDEQQLTILQTVYPDFAGVAFAPGTMEAVQ